MMMGEINGSPVVFLKDQLIGKKIISKSTVIGQLKGIFADELARAEQEQDKLVYEVQLHLPVDEGTAGGLFFGITRIHPGKVANEYHMTRGHFHANSDRAEYYWGIKGEGYLILMDRNRKIRAEKMQEGSLHYIPAHTAHRVANAGPEVLAFGACWPADAGHDYQEIADHGFSARLMEVEGQPALIAR